MRKPGVKEDAKSSTPNSEGMFSGMVVFLVESGIQPRRLQVWKQKLQQLGAEIANHVSKKVTHIFSQNSKVLTERLGEERLKKLRKVCLSYQWLEDCLKAGFKQPEQGYYIESQHDGEVSSHAASTKSSDENDSSMSNEQTSQGVGQYSQTDHEKLGNIATTNDFDVCSKSLRDKRPSKLESSNVVTVPTHSEKSLPSYLPPDLNRNITEQFKKIQTIYKDALGDDRRAFSYYKVISVLEKLPFKIETVDQIKGLPGIGKSMQEHIQEILQTGRLSKLDHFEKDEKIRTISLFGEVWGIGPATALKLYEKGHRNLKDLEQDNSLTQAQRIGLKFYEDIKRKIPRKEVQDMEELLQKVAQVIVPGIVLLCGGSYRRGKALCGDMDFVVTHPDGKSHKGFLVKFVEALKNIDFLKEDLLFSIHSTEGTEAGVDTYFGLCKYPGREWRHRIDIKVYPREIYAFGLIAWTGNDILNRRLRLIADEKGYKLDDTGLFLASQDSSGRRVSITSTSTPCKTEKDVFDTLGFPWLEPHERNL